LLVVVVVVVVVVVDVVAVAVGMSCCLHVFGTKNHMFSCKPLWFKTGFFFDKPLSKGFVALLPSRGTITLVKRDTPQG